MTWAGSPVQGVTDPTPSLLLQIPFPALCRIFRVPAVAPRTLNRLNDALGNRFPPNPSPEGPTLVGKMSRSLSAKGWQREPTLSPCPRGFIVAAPDKWIMNNSLLAFAL